LNDAIKHHFLPQYYLRHFQITPQKTKYPQVHVTEKTADARCFIASIHDTACVRDYNTIDMEGVAPDRNTIEKVLSHVEKQHSDLIAKLLSDCEVDDADRGDLSFLISLMLCRSPKFKRHVQNTLERSVETLRDVMLRNGQLPLPPPELAQELEDHGLTLAEVFEVNIYNWPILGQMFKCALGFRGILSQMNICVLTAPIGACFITGDSPVAIYGGALKHRNAEITLPISPRTMIMLSRGRVTVRDRVVSPDELREYNRRTIVMSDKYLYSTSAAPELRDLVSEHASESAGWTTNVIHRGRGAWITLQLTPVRASRCERHSAKRYGSPAC